MIDRQLYSGPSAVKQYLKPRKDNFSPLVELPSEINPYLDKYNIHIFVKLLNTLPLANVKSLPAWQMLNTSAVDLNGLNIVESSSGNTVFSLGLLAKHFGASSVQAVASNDVSPGKLKLLQLAGIDIHLVEGPLCPDANDPKSSISVARKFGERSGWHNPGQYENPANPKAHTIITGPQIYDQLHGDLAMFVAGLGTTGTLLGTTQYLTDKIPQLRVAGVVRVPNNAVPGVRTKNQLREIAFDWDSLITEGLIEVSEQDSYYYSLQMIRQGLLVGPSAGFALAGVLKQISRIKKRGDIDQLKNQNVVFIAPDSCFPYVDQYFEVLDSKYFPKIIGKPSFYQPEKSQRIVIEEVSVDDVLGDYIGDMPETMVSQKYKLIDVRQPSEYIDHHLPDSINVPYDKLNQWLQDNTLLKSQSLVFICRRGATSLRAAQMAVNRNFRAYSMTGGTTKWSAANYPRIKMCGCVV